MLGRFDPSVVARLSKIAGLFGSDHGGERSAAAWQATRLLQAHGLTWADVFAPAQSARPAAQAPHVAEAQWALRFKDRLNAWEQQFLAGLARRRRITAKQAAVLDGIVRKLRESRG
jgi:hypothetical protein